MTLAETHDIVGAFREPVNTASQSHGSIHDDATASKLGFKGGTVAGSLHMDQFAPLALELFGEAWWRSGNMSFYFRQATVDREVVRALARPGEPHARYWMENEAGALIAEGTASCKRSDAATSVQNLLESQTKSDPDGLRILKGVKVGQEVADLEAEVTRAALDHRLETITERLPVYERFRVLPVLIYDTEDGNVRCTSCNICAKVCPPQCIWMSQAKSPKGTVVPLPEDFYIDMDVCMNCGLCSEYCPFDAI